MAKYNAIYEGRLPHGMYNKVIVSNHVARQPGYRRIFMRFINKIYKSIIDFVG